LGNYHPQLNTQKCGIEGERNSKEQDFGRIARGGKVSTFV
jgi:hypothetical protein